MFSLLELKEVRESVRSLLKEDPKSAGLMQKIMLQFNEADRQLALSPAHRAGTVFAYETWICAALLDAVYNQTDYITAKSDCRAEWNMAVHTLKQELHRKKIFSGKPLYDPQALCGRAADALRCLEASVCGDCIFHIVEQKYGNTDAYTKSLQDLDFRLRHYEETE